MMSVMHMALFFSQILCLLAVFRCRLHTLLPWFTLSVILVLPLTFGYHPDPDAPWIDLVYLRAEPFLVILRWLAAVESIAILLPRRWWRYHTLLAILLLSGGLVLSIWLYTGRPELTTVTTRRYVQIQSFLISFFGLLILWRLSPRVVPWHWDFLRKHTVLYSLILLNHAAVSTYSLHIRRWNLPGWNGTRTLSFLAATVLYTAWTAAAVLSIRSVPRDVNRLRERVDLGF